MIGIRLFQPLQIGETYYASFYYNAAQRITGLRDYNCFTDKIGINFLVIYSDTIGLAERLIDNNPKLYSDKILTDTLGWTLFSGSFIADSAYTFLVIGNFFRNENIDHICNDSLARYSYTFIDHVCLSSNKNECKNQSVISDDIFSIYPNPSTGIFNIVDNLDQGFSEKEIKIYNVLGQIISKLNFSDKIITIDLSSFSKGVYFVCINNSVIKLLLI